MLLSLCSCAGGPSDVSEHETSTTITTTVAYNAEDTTTNSDTATTTNTTTSDSVETASAPTTTTTKKSTTAPKTTIKKADSIETLINSAKLNPQKTNAPALDTLVDTIFAQIHTKNMSTYDKVKACFDYLVNNCSYSSFGFGFLDTSVVDGLVYTSEYDYWLVLNSYLILSTKEGVCDNYSAAFAVMCRRIGLDAHIVGGTVSKKGGGRTGHAWAYINLNGQAYTFDPQVQSKNKNSPYYFFGKTYKQMGTTYEIDTSYYNAADFSNFNCYTAPDMDMQLNLEIVGATTFTESTHQTGNSLTSDISGLMNDGLKTDSNGCQTFTVTPSGGSGKYIFAILVTDDQNPDGIVVTEQQITGKTTYKLDCSSYDVNLNPIFYVYLIDQLDTDSYILLEGIQFVR